MHTADNVILNKSAVIENCMRRIRQENEAISSPNDFTHIDAMILNIERMCQAAIDIAMHLCGVQHLGIPQNSGQAFDLLYSHRRITESVKNCMKGMVGFRNVAIHEYNELDQSVVKWITSDGLRDIQQFLSEIGVTIVIPDQK